MLQVGFDSGNSYNSFKPWVRKNAGIDKMPGKKGFVTKL
jgi:hypothetical protein